MAQPPTEKPKQGDPPEPSPSTRQLAKSLTINLARVQGTGSGGMVTRQDVLNAHAAMVARGREFARRREARRQSATSAPSPSAARPKTPPQRRTAPAAATGVYAANPLIVQARAEPGGKRRVAAAEGQAPAPTLFLSGDLPAFTASGVDPDELTKVPWYARHHLASLSDKAAVEQLVRDYSGPDGDVMAQTDGVAGHRGNHDYADRMREWLDRGDVAAAQASQDRLWRQTKAARQQAQATREQGFTTENFDGLFSVQAPDAKGSL
ncbi:E3 binding domain-containing protein [Nonomuraea guangzhouensis]|uniref:E3 binding domain-containing protein n=1 Tax=Nonomuraea guangzhouensis TaxID=1291555 RepID=A0ABW4GYM2_9ACTN|nr:E3 binding domain-containing protein [Nonomuraea guangzhouensis]